MHLYQIDDEEYVIAKDPEDALAVMAALGAVPNVDEDFEVVLWPDNEPFTFSEKEGGKGITKTAREWCEERGRGWFCCTY